MKSLAANGSEFQTDGPATVKLHGLCVLFLVVGQPGHHGLLNEDDDDPQSHQHECTLMIYTTVHSVEGNCR